MSITTHLSKLLPYLQEWTLQEYDQLLFDSHKDNWTINNSVFDLYLQNKRDIVILLQTQNNIIGGYIHSFIDQLSWKDFNVQKGGSICDKSSFVCSFKNVIYNTNLNNTKFGNESEMKKENDLNDILRQLNSIGERNEIDMKKTQQNEKECEFQALHFPILPEKAHTSFTLYRKDSPLLFTFGNSDIVVTKQDYKTRNFCSKNAFNYLNGYKEMNLLENNGKEYPFDVEHIVVLQMKDKVIIENEEERKREISQIENWSGLKYLALLFDSKYDNWSMNDSIFDSCIFGKENIVVLVDDHQNNRFGVFLKSKIETYQYQEFGEWKGQSITDGNAFVFSVKSNNRFNGMMKFPIKSTDKEHAFILYKRDSPMLFCVGGNDISIKKEEYKSKCFCKQSSFSYQGKSNCLIGREGSENPFTVMRVRVLQFGRTYENEQKESDLSKIEEWSNTKCQKLIFDSNIDSWALNTSVFDKKLMYRNKITILIEDEDDNLFGVYVNAKIDTYQWKENNEWKGKAVTDQNCFVFTLFSNGRTGATKCPLKQGVEGKFTLFKKDFALLFTVGENDIVVFKEENKLKCQCRPNSFYYLGYDGILVGRENVFVPRRIQVYQMK